MNLEKMISVSFSTSYSLKGLDASEQMKVSY